MKDGTEVVSIDYSLECGRRLAFFYCFRLGDLVYLLVAMFTLVIRVDMNGVVRIIY